MEEKKSWQNWTFSGSQGKGKKEKKINPKKIKGKKEKGMTNFLKQRIAKGVRKKITKKLWKNN